MRDHVRQAMDEELACCGGMNAVKRSSRAKSFMDHIRDEAAARRARLIAVWWALRGAYGGDGWEGWTDDEIVQVMDGWVGEPVPGQRAVDELLDQSFDPRDFLHLVRPRRARLIAVWWDLRNAYGGDGWEGWTDDEIVQVMDGWVGEPVPGQRAADELLDQSFDPRDVIHLYRRG